MKIKGWILIGSLLLCACSDKKTDEKKNHPIDVKIVSVGSLNGNPIRTYTGKIEAGKTAELSFTGGGTLTNVPVEVGMQVSKGQFIAEVNKQLALDDYKLALANEAKALDSYQRYNNMYEAKSLPEAQWVDAKNALEQARIQVRIAKKQLNDCRLTAPFSGYIISKDVQNGQNVAAGMSVVTIADINTVKVSIHVPSTDMGAFRKGQDIQVIVPELNDKRFTAIVIEKGINADSYTHTYTIKALIKNTKGELLPGMLCSLDGYKEKETLQVIIPENIVQIDFDNSRFVWLDHDNRAERRKIEVGEVTSSGVIVKSGLSFGDRIISEGQQKVFDGAVIRVKKEK